MARYLLQAIGLVLFLLQPHLDYQNPTTHSHATELLQFGQFLYFDRSVPTRLAQLADSHLYTVENCFGLIAHPIECRNLSSIFPIR